MRIYDLFGIPCSFRDMGKLAARINAAERAEELGGREISARQTVVDQVMASSITLSDSFNLSSARLNKPQGLDLR
jgi:hypothetical protein